MMHNGAPLSMGASNVAHNTFLLALLVFIMRKLSQIVKILPNEPTVTTVDHSMCWLIKNYNQNLKKKNFYLIPLVKQGKSDRKIIT